MTDPLVPTVEMLWEDADPAAVLEERLGHADAASLGRWVAATVVEHWGRHVDMCSRVVVSAGNALAWVRTEDGDLLVKWSVVPDLFPRLARTALLTAWLDRNEVPVSAPVPALDDSLQVELDTVSVGVQRVVEGDLLDVDDPAQVRATGVALARMHLALAAYDDAGLDGSPAQSLAAAVTAWADRAGPQVPVEVRRTLRRTVADLDDPGPTQLVHGDVRSANVLCRDGEVVALLDLEEVRGDHPVAELARTAVLLGTRYRDWAPVSDDVRAALMDGYESVRPLDDGERVWWPALLTWQAWARVPDGPDPTSWGAAARRSGPLQAGGTIVTP